MWRVLLVEDEPFVRRTLKKQIPWEECGFELAAEAENGLEALELMRREQPELVITDIMMPGMDGLELLRRGKSEFDAVKFVMLTCVNEFEYARQALEHGATGYLLKLSADTDALKSMLQKVGRELSQENVRKREHRELWFGALYDKLWNAMEAGEPPEGPPLPEEWPEAMASPAPAYLTAAAILHGGAEECFCEAAEHRLRSGLPKQAELHRYSRNGVATFLIWSPGPLPNGFIPDRTGGMAVAAAGSPTGLHGLRSVWSEAILQLNREWYGTSGAPEPGKNGRHAESGHGAPHPGNVWKKERELYRMLEQTELARALATLEELWSGMAAMALPIPQVLHTARRIDLQVNRLFDGHGSDGGAEPEWLSAGSHSRLLRVLKQRMEQAVKRSLRQAEAQTDREDINAIIQYIHGHLSENITLKAMAQLVNMDENYVSVLFRRKTGETLINFIQQCRVERAKKLLLETELSIPEINEQAGFNNENYFFRIFKRWTGETPGKYRSRHRGK